MATTTPQLDGERPGRNRTPSRFGDIVKGLVDLVVDIVHAFYYRFERAMDGDSGDVSVLKMLGKTGYWATTISMR